MPAAGGGAPLQNVAARNINLSLQGLSNENVVLKMQMQPTFDVNHCLTAVVHLTKIGQRIPDGNVFVWVIGHHAMSWFESVTRNKGKGEAVRKNVLVIMMLMIFTSNSHTYARNSSGHRELKIFGILKNIPRKRNSFWPRELESLHLP
jgi:hypothetical protein